MENVERGGRWRILRERLGIKGIGCCGATWGSRASTMSEREVEDNGEQQHEQEELISVGQIPAENNANPAAYVGQTPAASGMNLATALAAERHLRSTQDGGAATTETTGPTPGTPQRVSLMRLIAETDGEDGEREKERGGGSDVVCCVCMERKKGAALVPCGHTFCRVCSRELWLNRGSCPICNHSIVEILDIF
ncbi:hypothetical protein HHK36_002157 [Tetracentron sinense]|uniref:RING-type domain-containing protein n=1 Tax=Tetracentron sinense TaxID=13715 RepID=A0A834ZZC7_TETSI|nr:hypothetical protein HHK36_002157 [Tetracentron sinense]